MTSLPVVDGDEGATILGFASNDAGAVRVAHSEFPDGCRYTELTSDNVELCNGETLLGEKWIAYQIGSPAETAYLATLV